MAIAGTNWKWNRKRITNRMTRENWSNEISPTGNSSRSCTMRDLIEFTNRRAHLVQSLRLQIGSIDTMQRDVHYLQMESQKMSDVTTAAHLFGPFTSTKRLAISVCILSINISTQCRISFFARYKTSCVNGTEMACAFCCSALYLATSRAIVVINAAGRAVAISRRACRAVRHASACGVNGNFVLKLGIKRLASQHVSSKPEQTQNWFSVRKFPIYSPKRTLLTSRYGSQTVKPRPIKSIAARRSGVWAGSFGVGGANNKCVRAIDVRRAKLLFPIPNPSTTELFLLWSFAFFEAALVPTTVERRKPLHHLTKQKNQISPLLSVEISWPNSAPMTPSNTTAVVCFRFNSAKLDGFLITSSSSSSYSSGCNQKC